MVTSRLYIISAPSGAGKSSLIQALLNSHVVCNTQLSVSHTTRAIRPGEVQGIHYEFVSIKEFEKMIDENAFLEYARVFGHYYGTSYRGIHKMLQKGVDVFLDIDWQGAKQVRDKISNVCSIFILPPSKEELKKRLSNRAQDSRENIEWRMAQVVTEIIHVVDYDYLIINDEFNTALFELKSIIYAERLRIKCQSIRYRSLIAKFLS
ncbi:guanylate kinase [Candidatus Schneideria nysicola]|uniref:guanylate kinase n=1 Tax=Candidatus Schneideria nysicola TaxID=1081631 RepID=UPI001CAA58FD|nr:guanylate kinase [Candidatus Schneideria nysicola]UAJ65501.1 guanylate kinase [Candidatus Schneideria nysicola]